MSKPKTYAEASQEIRDGVEQLIRTYGSDPALLAGAIVAATTRAILAAKAEERQSVILWLDAAREGLNKLAEKYDDKDNRVQAERCIVRAATHSIAAQAIRQGEHVNTAHKLKTEA